MKAYVTKIEESQNWITVSLTLSHPSEPSYDPLDPEDYPVLSYFAEEDIKALLTTEEHDRDDLFATMLEAKGLPQQSLNWERSEEVLRKKLKWYEDMKKYEHDLKIYKRLHLGEAELRQVEE